MARQLYIDAEGVQRGYYVYLHRDRTTADVFYVGKGHGRRAWDAKGRSSLWKEKVSLIGGAWDVEIVRDDLSEIEAFELEAELVQKYGGAECRGGTLVNLIPGGEDPFAVAVEFPGFYLNGDWFTAYNAARKFKAFSREEEETRVSQLKQALESIVLHLEALEKEAEENEDGELEESVIEVDFVIDNLCDATYDFLKRRISWKKFALAVEEAVEDVEMQQEDVKHERVAPLFEQLSVLVEEFFEGIDSGNRSEAEQIANRGAANS